VYVHPAKKKILECIELSPSDKALLTTEATASRLHVVPMGCIAFKHMALLLKMNRD
ncbi:hypothetical protein T484DRAFT_1790223, partial [Baffinella frigidus]